MKKFLIIVLVLLCFPSVCLANEKSSVKLKSCIDGDTANFIMKKETIKVRFLAIDTPETKHPTKGSEPYGKEASNYTCKRLKEAKKIVLEFDSNSDKIDKYNRYLAWVFVDNNLLQDELVKKGFADVKYLYGNYTYTDRINTSLKKAKNNKVGMWNESKSIDSELKNYVMNLKIEYKILITIILIVIVGIYLYYDKKARKRAFKKGKRELKKYIDKQLK